MDMTVDVNDIPVAPEYPVQEVHITETYFTNARKVQLIEEVRGGDITVEEFLARYSGEGRAVSATKPAATAASAETLGESQTNAGSGLTAKTNDAAQPIVRPHADRELIPGVDVFNIYFPQGESSLGNFHLALIEELPTGMCFRLAGFASPEGSSALNLRLSEDRAREVAGAIEATGRKVLAHGGLGEYSAHIWPSPWPIERRVEVYVEDCD